MARPVVTIPDRPEHPFPITTTSEIVSGFGRGSSQLGIPTANIDILKTNLDDLDTGVYFGFCQLSINKNHETETKKRVDGTDLKFNYGQELEAKEFETLPMVMSIGWNPFYKNKSKTAELHVISRFSDNFYGAMITFNVLGYIRPELDYTTKEALIEDIKIDIKIALERLSTPGYQLYKF